MLTVLLTVLIAFAILGLIVFVLNQIPGIDPNVRGAISAVIGLVLLIWLVLLLAHGRIGVISPW